MRCVAICNQKSQWPSGQRVEPGSPYAFVLFDADEGLPERLDAISSGIRNGEVFSYRDMTADVGDDLRSMVTHLRELCPTVAQLQEREVQRRIQERQEEAERQKAARERRQAEMAEAHQARQFQTQEQSPEASTEEATSD